MVKFHAIIIFYDTHNKIDVWSNSVTELTKEIETIDRYRISSIEVYACGGDELFWLDDINLKYVYESICDAISYRMIHEEKFRDYAIKY